MMSHPGSTTAPDGLLLFTPIVAAYRGKNGWFARAWELALVRGSDLSRSMAQTGRGAARYGIAVGLSASDPLRHRLALAACAFDEREKRRWKAGVGATKLLADATELPDGREM